MWGDIQNFWVYAGMWHIKMLGSWIFGCEVWSYTLTALIGGIQMYTICAGSLETTRKGKYKHKIGKGLNFPENTIKNLDSFPCGYSQDLDFCPLYFHMTLATLRVETLSCLGQAALRIACMHQHTAQTLAPQALRNQSQHSFLF